MNPPDQGPDAHAAVDEADEDSLARFRSWHGFLLATVVLNLLFVYGMLGNVADPTVRTWFKALVWLPFNAIASAVYLILAVKLSRGAGARFFRALCLFMAIGNWAVMWLAGN